MCLLPCKKDFKTLKEIKKEIICKGCDITPVTCGKV